MTDPRRHGVRYDMIVDGMQLSLKLSSDRVFRVFLEPSGIFRNRVAN